MDDKHLTMDWQSYLAITTIVSLIAAGMTGYLRIYIRIQLIDLKKEVHDHTTAIHNAYVSVERRVRILERQMRNIYDWVHGTPGSGTYTIRQQDKESRDRERFFDPQAQQAQQPNQPNQQNIAQNITSQTTDDIQDISRYANDDSDLED